jgi:hypothetical protein
VVQRREHIGAKTEAMAARVKQSNNKMEAALQ